MKNLHQRISRFFYDRNLYKLIKSAICNRDDSVDLSDDFLFLKKVNQYFKIPAPNKYDLGSIMGRAEERFDMIGRNFTSLKGMDLLDIGAGHGENLFFNKKYMFRSATGIDYSSDKFYEHFKCFDEKSLGDVGFIEGDFLSLDLKEKQYDFVVSINSFEHFSDPTRVLDKCYTLLREGGYLFVRFAPLFHSPFGAHRYGYSAVPYIQNIFSSKVAYKFFYNELKINPGVNRYTGELIRNEDPYPEMNKWKVDDFRKLFTEDDRLDVVAYHHEYNYSYSWMTKLFKDQLEGLSDEDLFVAGLFVLLRKKAIN